MRTANLVIAILYSTFLGLLFFFSFTTAIRSDYPYQTVAILFSSGPVLVNWISFKQLDRVDTRTKTLNLVIAVIYTIFFAMSCLTADQQEFAGLLLLSVPIMVNWLTFFAWPEAKDSA